MPRSRAANFGSAEHRDQQREQHNLSQRESRRRQINNNRMELSQAGAQFDRDGQRQQRGNRAARRNGDMQIDQPNEINEPNEEVQGNGVDIHQMNVQEFEDWLNAMMHPGQPVPAQQPGQPVPAHQQQPNNEYFDGDDDFMDANDGMNDGMLDDMDFHDAQQGGDLDFDPNIFQPLPQ